MLRAILSVAMALTALAAVLLFVLAAAARGGLWETADPGPAGWIMAASVAGFAAAVLAA